MIDFSKKSNPISIRIKMNLKSISNESLLTETNRLVKNEREQLTKILYHLKEIETRRLFSSLSYKSLFDYATKELGYSEDQAMRRISAMRLLKELPEIETKISEGALTLSHIGKAQSLFQKEKKLGKPFTSEQKQQLLSQIENKSVREAEKIVLSLSSSPQTLHTERIRSVTPELSEIKFLATEELLAKIEKLKGLLAHSKPQISMTELLHKLCDLGINQWDLANKTVRKQPSPATSKKQCVSQSGECANHPRKEDKKVKRTTIPMALKKEVWQKAKSQCENCGSNYALEIDHIKPVALGGDNNRKNLRLLCRQCNQYHAIQKIGMQQMQVYLQS